MSTLKTNTIQAATGSTVNIASGHTVKTDAIENLSGVSLILPDEHFRYGLSGNQSLATATWAIAQFNTALFNLSNSNFNTSSYRYVVPANKAGVYRFETQQNWITAGDFDNCMIALYKNSGGAAASGTQIGFSNVRQEAYETSIAIGVVRLEVGDYVDVHIRQESGGTISFRQADSTCWFQGSRIGL